MGNIVPLANSLLTIDDFREQYGRSERAYEFWFGEAVEKSVPTWLHSLLQAILVLSFTRAGYKAAPELDLRMDPQFQPRPDLSATRRPIRGRYPSDPADVEIVVEIVSPDDTMLRLYAKCGNYHRLGIAQIFVIDPESKTGWQWNAALRQLDRTEAWTLTNGEVIDLEDVWQALQETL